MTDRTGGPGGSGRIGRITLLLALLAAASSSALAQSLTQRGFAEGSAFLFPQQAPNDRTQAIADFLAREELFFKPMPWLQFAGGLDLRANSHDQVEDSWRLDGADRGIRRPRLSLRRLSATFAHGPVTIDAGKQFIRWGKADIINPTDRFAPRDFLNVVDNEFLPVIGLRGVVSHGDETFEAVWVPRLTPSRVPLLDQRWTAVPADVFLTLVDGGAVLPGGSETGLRWGHVGAGFEYSLSFFDGFNHLPNIALSPQTGRAEVDVVRVYPAIRTYGADAAVPTKWFTIKGEAAYFTSRGNVVLPGPSADGANTDDYVLYVIQIERQTGEWVLVAGYAGEAVTVRRAAVSFAPDRGLTKSIVARASYTIDPARSVAFEAAIRQNGAGAYGKVEYSHARGLHWRATVTAVAIGGDLDDFLGQYRRNSHANVALRYSF